MCAGAQGTSQEPCASATPWYDLTPCRAFSLPIIVRVFAVHAAFNQLERCLPV
jgi:hypothetical protein